MDMHVSMIQKGHFYIVYANNGNVFIPTCINVNKIQALTNFSNCFEDLPVIVTYILTNVSAFLTTDLILRTTSRIVNCNMIKYRFFDFLIPKFYSNKLAPQLVKSNVRNFVVCNRQILWFTSIKNHLNDCSKKIIILCINQLLKICLWKIPSKLNDYREKIKPFAIILMGWILD
jgi:hypothetical protein